MARRLAGTADAAPRRVGSFEILKQLGEGGMGVVYLAEQRKPFRRRAAVKLIKLGFETDQIIARFESEQQALALMSHANVAHIFEAGTTERGRPYFAMELIDGEPIQEYCDERRLTIRKRLELFLQVCAGVQHAHQNAIVHRDLKPSNVLVAVQDGRPVPKVIDFGVAKAIDMRLTKRTFATRSEQVVGTPEYMSPEQADTSERNIDTRADVYSLGVMLYELLTGTLPFTSGGGATGLDEIRRRIREDEPSKPSTRVGVRGEEGTKASWNRRLDRSSLARRLRGDLDWIVLKALDKDREQRYTSPSELAADIRRHLDSEPVQAGSPGASYRMRRFVRKHRAAVGFAGTLFLLLATFAVTGTLQARRISREAAATELVAETMIGLFKGSSDSGLRGPSEFTPERVLDRAAETVSRELGDQPIFQSRLRNAMGVSYEYIGHDKKAQALLEDSVSQLREMLGSAHPQTLDAVDSLARFYLHQRRFEEAEHLFRETRETRRHTLGSDHPDFLRSTTALAFLYKQWGRSEEAERLLIESVAGKERLLGRNHPETLIASGYLAGVQLDLRKYEELASHLPDLLERLRVVLGDNHMESIAALFNLACVHANLGQRDLALAGFRQSVDRGFERRHLFTSPHLGSLQGDHELLRLLAPTRRDTPSSWLQSSHDARWAQDPDQVERELRRVLDAAKRSGRRNHPHAQTASMDLVSLLFSQGRFQAAESELVDNLEFWNQQPEQDPWVMSNVLWTLAQAQVAQGGRHEEAAELIRRSVSIYESLNQTGLVAYGNASLAILAGRREDALEHLTLACALGGSPAELHEDPIIELLAGDPDYEAWRDEMMSIYQDR